VIAAPPDLRVDRLLALDPGSRNVGVALFERVDHPDAHTPWTGPWRLRAALDVHPDGTAAGAVADIGGAIGPWRVSAGGVAFVAEYPRPYRGRRDAHDDIAALRAVVDRLAAAPWAYPWSQVVRIAPAAWKGQTPKAIAHVRYRRALAPAETGIWDPLGPDARDAVGIGLWATGRHPNTPAIVTGDRRQG
jgi:hypothetical protein